MTEPSSEDQIKAILSMDTFHWAVRHLIDAGALGNLRFRDLIEVIEDEIYDFVLANGFDPRAVAEGVTQTTISCIAPVADGRWLVYYTERGDRSDEVAVPSLADAR